MLPALGEYTRVDQYKLQALGDTDGPVSRLGAGLDSRGPKLPWGAGDGGRAGCRRRPPDPARSSGSQAVGTMGTGGEMRQEASGGHGTESFKGRWRGTQGSSWGQWMLLKHVLPAVNPSTSHQ